MPSSDEEGMSPWVEAIGVALLASVGMLLGAWFSRRPRPIWLLGYFIPLAMVCLYDAGNQYPALAFIPPVSWILLGRAKFAVFGFITSMLLTTPLSRLPRKRDRRVVGVLMLVLVAFVSVWPFLAPAFNQRELAALVTKMDSDGVCLQTTGYTCGPAAAVTALRRLGFNADEGQLAVLAHCTSFTGTPADILADTLQSRYGREGLKCEYRGFRDVAELKDAGLTLAVVKFNFIVDHYVTVLSVNDRTVTFGDPLNGLTTMSRHDFGDIWRFCGITMSRR
jgi:hypothetical protein